MHCTCLWAANPANIAPEMAEITVIGQLVQQIYRGIAAKLLVFGHKILVFFPRVSGGTAGAYLHSANCADYTPQRHIFF